MLDVQTTLGPVRGFIDTHPISEVSNANKPTGSESPIRKWLGIPFAQCERWSYGCPPQPWTESRECYEFGPAPPQPASAMTAIWSNAGVIMRKIPFSDTECLNLNVFAPEHGENLPVMIWIYGGAFRNGSSSLSSLGDPTEIIRHFPNVIVVTGNHRVNLTGFIDHPDLRSTDPQGRSGNYGIHDQQLLIRWVVDNVQRFGGDPKNITVFGESAGAMGAAVHMTLEGSKGVKRYILQSGTADVVAVKSDDQIWPQLVKYCGVDENLDAREKVPLEKLMEALINHPQWRYIPSLGSIIPSHPSKKIAGGGINDDIEDIILGYNTDEGSLFGRGAMYNLTELDSMNKFLAPFPPPVASAIQKMYPGLPNDGRDMRESHRVEADLIADFIFITPTILLARHLAAAREKERKGPTVRLYKFDHIMAWLKNHMEQTQMYHLELPSIFLQKQCFKRHPSVNEIDWKLSLAMTSLWIQFSVNGDPKDWPPYQGEGGSIMYFGYDNGEVEKEESSGERTLLNEENGRKAALQLWSMVFTGRNTMLKGKIINEGTLSKYLMSCMTSNLTNTNKMIDTMDGAIVKQLTNLNKEVMKGVEQSVALKMCKTLTSLEWSLASTHYLSLIEYKDGGSADH
ncbi:para-nitrobenzyl esterase (intracellular esterase B), partial [Planoprotostelium fungivorum]